MVTVSGFCCRKFLLLLVLFFVLIFLLPSIANAFPGWDNIDTIYYDAYKDGSLTKFMKNAADELKLHLEDVSGKTFTLKTNNVALYKTTITGSINLGNVVPLTDGVIDSMPYVRVGYGKPEWIQLDLESQFTVSRVHLRHLYHDSRIYHDVIVQLSEDGVTWTNIFNNDADNSAGQGIGTDAEYVGTRAGKDIIIAPTKARYVRAWSNGNSVDTINYYIELEVYDQTVFSGSETGIHIKVNPNLPEFADKGDEAFKLYTDANGIHIIGKTPIAARHGAYELLDKLGFRWFFKHPAWTIVPDTLISLDGLNEVLEPFYFWRSLYAGIPTDRQVNYAWSARNRLFGAKHYFFGEAWAGIISKTEFSEHPEYFLPEDWNGTSWPWKLNPDNSDVLDRAIQYTRSRLTSDPIRMTGGDYLPLAAWAMTPNDGGGWDPPWDEDTDEGRQTITDKVFYLANEVAKAIKDEFPDKYIGVLAYAHYAGVPTFDLESNLIAMITTGYDYTPLTRLERIDGMLAKNIKVAIYDYYDIWYWWFDRPLLRIYADSGSIAVNQISWYATKGIRMFNAEGADGWGGRGLTYYVASKLFWKPDADLDAILDDFYTKAFGPAKETMKRYYERSNQGISADVIGYNFLDLKEAKSLAAGDEKILERIRQLEYYQRFVWIFHTKGIANLDIDELKDLYTYITRLRSLYVVDYYYNEQYLRQQLKSRDLTDLEIDALQDFTPPTEAEANAWLNEAIAALAPSKPELPVIDLNHIELVPLNDATKPKLEPLFASYGKFLIPSEGNEDITVLVKGELINGDFELYNPYGIQVGSQTVQTALDWTPLIFPADVPGNYVLKTNPYPPRPFYVDVPGRPASMVIYLQTLGGGGHEDVPFIYNSGVPPQELYFHVPDFTSEFILGLRPGNYVGQPAATGRLIDPLGNIALEWSLPSIAVPGEPHSLVLYDEPNFPITNPIGGIWKIVFDDGPWIKDRFWLLGIPPLIWHNPEYLLVQSSESLPPQDITSPVRGSGLPSGSLAGGTTQATISLSTNEASTCKYSLFANAGFDAMENTFSSTGGVSHSRLVTGLADGGSYTYYVKCSDSSGNKNSADFVISFGVAPSAVATDIPSQPVSSGSSGGGGGSSGGGGSGGGSAVVSNVLAKVARQWDVVGVGEEVVFEVRRPEIAISAVSFTPVRQLSSVDVSVAGLKGRPAGLGDIGSSVYEFDEVLHSFADGDVDKIKIYFSVGKSWLGSANPGAVRLFRYDDSADSWSDLPTEYLRSDLEFAYFLADSPGLSVFAVSLVELVDEPVVPVETPVVSLPVVDNEPVYVEPLSEESFRFSAKLMLVLAGIFVLVLVIVAVVYKLSRKKPELPATYFHTSDGHLSQLVSEYNGRPD